MLVSGSWIGPTGIDHLIWCLENQVDTDVTEGDDYFTPPRREPARVQRPQLGIVRRTPDPFPAKQETGLGRSKACVIPPCRWVPVMADDLIDARLNGRLVDDPGSG